MKNIFIIFLTGCFVVSGCKKSRKDGDTKSAEALQYGDMSRRHPDGMYCGKDRKEGETPVV